MIELLTDDLKFAGVPRKLVAPLRYLKNRVESRNPADFTDLDELRGALTEAVGVQQGIFEDLCTFVLLETASTRCRAHGPRPARAARAPSALQCVREGSPCPLGGPARGEPPGACQLA